MKSSHIKKDLVNDYKEAAAFMVAPLALSADLISTKNGADPNISSGFRILGLLTLPAMIALTPVTVVGGLLYAIGVTGKAAVTGVHDLVKGQKQNAASSKLSSSHAALFSSAQADQPGSVAYSDVPLRLC